MSRAGAVRTVGLGALAVVALAGVASAGPPLGVYKEHYGVYATPPRGPVLPWAVGKGPGPAAEATGRRPAGAAGGRLPWRRPAVPVEVGGRVDQWFDPPPGGAEAQEPEPPVEAPAGAARAVEVRRPALVSWTTATYVLGPGWGWARSGAWPGRWRGTRVGWVWGPRVGRSFVFSTRAGLVAFSTGRFGFAVRW